MQTRLHNILSGALLVTTTLLLAGCGPNLFDRVGNFWSLGCCGAIIVILDIMALVELAGSPRTVGTKVLWALIIIFMPLLGCILYYFFGR
ncbi:MAG TPA: PLD nuclease N-terminal domain-containing protein [Rhodothermales bacterium]|nr:PLD nuclease N-terminal domain-containing protein [Rhodothermales bacterium]